MDHMCAALLFYLIVIGGKLVLPAFQYMDLVLEVAVC